MFGMVMTGSEDIINAELPDVRVGIGAGKDRASVERDVARFPGNVIVYDDPEALVNDLADGTIDAALRGNMSSSVVLPLLKKALGLEELERVVIMEPAGGRMFCMAPVGIDEGWTEEQKLDIVRKSMPLLKALGLGNRIAVMSGGREDDMGRNDQVDRTIRDARSMIPKLRSEGYDAYDAQILLEDAVKEADFIIAPDGISGNIIFRALHFIAGAKALGAPVINTDKVFVDTSRAKTDYVDSIALAMKLTEKIV